MVGFGSTEPVSSLPALSPDILPQDAFLGVAGATMPVGAMRGSPSLSLPDDPSAHFADDHAPHPDTDAIMQVLARAAPDRMFDQPLINRELLEIVAATGIFDGTEERRRHWRELVNAQPGAAEAASGLERAADAENPLAHGVLDPRLRAEFAGMLRNRWAARWKRERRNAAPALRNLEWENLSPKERSEVREMLLALAAHRRRSIRRGRIHKTALDTALQELALQYTRWTGNPGEPTSLPHSPNGLFIRFANLTLRPFGEHFEISAKALSRRWERLKARDRAALSENAD